MTLLAFIMGALFGAALRGRPWRTVERVRRLGVDLRTLAERRNAESQSAPYRGAAHFYDGAAIALDFAADEIERTLRGGK